MSYIYHQQPTSMRGSTLYPLNQLKEIAPDIYSQQIKKYDDRPYLLKRKIALLDCYWNDVLHCSSIHPTHIYQVWANYGIELNSTLKWFKIPLKHIRASSAVIYKNIPHQSKSTLLEQAFEPLNPSIYKELEALPETTLDFYQHLIAQGKRGGFFHGVPHVLVKASIDISGIELVNWC